MKEKYEVFTLFVKIFHLLKTQLGKSIRRLQWEGMCKSRHV